MLTMRMRMVINMLMMRMMVRMWEDLPQSPRGSTGGIRDWRKESQNVTFEKTIKY